MRARSSARHGRATCSARAVVAEEARRIALYIAPIAAVTDVALVVLGGGIGANGDLLLDPIRGLLGRVAAVPAEGRGVGSRRRRGPDGRAGGRPRPRAGARVRQPPRRAAGDGCCDGRCHGRRRSLAVDSAHGDLLALRGGERRGRPLLCHLRRSPGRVAGPGGAEGRDDPLLRSRRVDEAGRALRSRGAPAAARPLLRRREDDHRAPRRHDREVHRRRRLRGLRHADGPGGRRAAESSRRGRASRRGRQPRRPARARPRRPDRRQHRRGLRRRARPVGRGRRGLDGEAARGGRAARRGPARPDHVGARRRRGRRRAAAAGPAERESRSRSTCFS